MRVWILLFYMGDHGHMIEDLKDLAECTRVQRVVQQFTQYDRAKCMEVVKKGPTA